MKIPPRLKVTEYFKYVITFKRRKILTDETNDPRIFPRYGFQESIQVPLSTLKILNISITKFYNVDHVNMIAAEL